MCPQRAGSSGLTKKSLLNEADSLVSTPSGDSQGEQIGLLDKQVFGRQLVALARVRVESVGGWLASWENGSALVCSAEASVRPSERHRDGVACACGGLLDRGAPV